MSALVLVGADGFAQLTLNGMHITDQNGKAVSGATIKSVSGAFNGTTDSSGDVRFQNQGQMNTTSVIYLPPAVYPDGTTNVDLKDRSPAATTTVQQESGDALKVLQELDQK